MNEVRYKVRKYFESFEYNFLNLEIIVLTHILNGRKEFIHKLNSIGRVAHIYTKPNTINKQEFKSLEQNYTISIANRNNMTESVHSVIERISENKKIIFLDIGGYFLNYLSYSKDNRILGVVEDTLNGERRYANKDINFPVVSVAKSPLKRLEDVFVGEQIAESTIKIIEHTTVY